MPLYARPIEPGDPFIPEDLLLMAEEPEIPEPTTGELIQAGMRLTPTGGIIGGIRSYEPDPEFVPDWKNLPAKYDPFIDDLEDARSLDEFRYKMLRIDRELAAYDTLHRGGGAGIAWGIATGVADPVTLPLWMLAPARLLEGASVAKTAAVIGGFAAADAAVSEALLQATQDTRQAEDSAVSIGGAAILGALLGTGGGYIAQRLGKKKVETLSEAVHEELGDSVRVRRAQFETQSVGAGQASTSFKQESPLRAPGRVTGVTTINNPIQRMLWDEYSVTAKRIVDELVPHNILKHKHLEGVAPTHTPLATVVDQSVDRATAEIVLAVREARRALRKRGIRLSEDEISVIAGKAATRGDRHEFPEIVGLVKKFRRHVDDWTEQAIRLKILSREDTIPRTALSYFPRIYDKDAISRHYQRWRKVLSNHYKATADVGQQFEAAELDAIVDAITMTIRGTPTGRMTMPWEIAGAFSGRFKPRTNDVPDVQLEEFLVRDIRLGLRHFMKSVVPEVALKSRYGADDVTLSRGADGYSVSIGQVEQAIADDYALAINRAADSGKSTKAIQDSRDQTLKDLRHILGRATGLDAPGHQFGHRFSTEVRSWIAASTLGNIVLASMADHANVVLQHGLGNFIKTRPAAWKLGKLSESAKADFDAFSIGLDHVLSTRMMRFADIEDVPASQGVFTFGQTRAAPAVFRYTGANRWNRSLKRGAAVAAQNRIIADSIRFDAIGKIRKAKLASAGVDQGWAKRFAEQYLKFGEKRQGVHYANTRAWDDVSAAERFEQILHREVETTIVTPQAGDTPIILDNAFGKFVTQFKKTVFAMQTQIVIPLSQRLSYGDVSAMNAVVTMVGLGMLQEYVRAAIRHRFDERKLNRELDRLTTADWMRAGIDRSGASLFFLEAFNVADHIAQGRFSNSLGMSESSRYYFRNQGVGSFVPAFGYVEDIGRVAGSPFKEGGPTTGDLRTLRRLVPFQNAFYAAWLFNEAENAIAETAGLPKTKPRKRRYARRQVKF